MLSGSGGPERPVTIRQIKPEKLEHTEGPHTHILSQSYAYAGVLSVSSMNRATCSRKGIVNGEWYE